MRRFSKMVAIWAMDLTMLTALIFACLFVADMVRFRFSSMPLEFMVSTISLITSSLIYVKWVKPCWEFDLLRSAAELNAV